jgi:hypothetical protein
MYKITELTGDEARSHATNSPPSGMAVPHKMSQLIERVEIWGTSFTDPGPDHTDHRAFDKEGNLITNYIISGY